MAKDRRRRVVLKESGTGIPDLIVDNHGTGSVEPVAQPQKKAMNVRDGIGQLAGDLKKALPRTTPPRPK